ncbi:MAG: exodeoxyribonuclease VII large subunit [Proteobacteria bacterium]|nr:exodeoxyribonuclease VII large subunit [Pseudomonadota bacterium]MBU1686583.1 exodeoxyribonuclease VII large subunit [Pseudomonadota bacterium]
MHTFHSIRIQSVSELTRSIRGLLETEFPFVSVTGEISNLRKPSSGHLYFTLKDADAQIKAVLFRPQQRYLNLEPRDGQEVVCRGRISLYEPRGEYQIIADTLEEKGAGLLQAAFEKLKRDLATEGLFDPSHKQEIPLLPARITLVTSPDGAAVHDFITMAERRFPHFPLEIYPVAVQGSQAPRQIIDAIEWLNRESRTELIVLCRGGGSLEDLWAFNDEQLARAIYASTIPVVSAIGHEIDFTIADFVADYRAPTPTSAAEAVVPDRDHLTSLIQTCGQRLIKHQKDLIINARFRVRSHKRVIGDPSLLLRSFRYRLAKTSTDIHATLSRKLGKHNRLIFDLAEKLQGRNPGHQLAVTRQKLEGLEKRLQLQTKKYFEKRHYTIRSHAALLDAVSPLSILARGYSITTILPQGTLVRESNQLTIGGQIEIILQRGKVKGTVTAIE